MNLVVGANYVKGMRCVPRSTLHLCSYCTQTLLISPRGVKLIRAGGYKPICMDCVEVQTAGGKVIIEQPTWEQMASDFQSEN